MLILGIETSCDETAAAVVCNGEEVLSNVIFSQIARHQQFGGVVPEIASRCHVEMLPHIIDKAVRMARLSFSDISAIAATRGPGLATSLLVGFTAAKALALRLEVPLLGINHLEAHLHSVFLGTRSSSIPRPLLILLASGGHTALALWNDAHDYELLGETCDDAAGEALDKGAKLLGLEYPGGPALEKATQGGNPAAIRFPRGLPKRKGIMNARYSFSFSGLKTALLYHLKEHPLHNADPRLPDIAASYQEAVIDTLARRVERALDELEIRAIGCAGGVARNARLRERIQRIATHRSLPLLLAQPEFCTDNAAMIAAAAAFTPAIPWPDYVGEDAIATAPPGGIAA